LDGRAVTPATICPQAARALAREAQKGGTQAARLYQTLSPAK